MRMRHSLAASYAVMLLCFLSGPVHAADTLYTNQTLSNGGYIQSAQGLYTLVMQTDGNLVIYRSDGSVRFATMKFGAFALMQSDGNFVQYTSTNAPLWATNTGGTGPANILKIHDDGDLVVYAQNGSRVWSLGTDPAFGDPSKVADVLGRDLAFTGAGYLGHLGIWDGNRVFEVGPPTSGTNAVHITSLFDFKHTPTNTGGNATYWGTVSYKIPSGSIYMTGCWETTCPVANSVVSADARYSVALRLMQIYRIGADYTATASYTRSLAAYNGYPTQRGRYRCDTFIKDALKQSTYYHTPYTSDQSTWVNRWNDLDGGLTTPQAVYNKLKTFQ